MSIKIKVSLDLRRLINHTEVVEVNGSTVGECLKHLVEQFPPIGDRLFSKQGLLLYVNIHVNRENAYPESLAKPVRDGDEIRITSVIGGDEAVFLTN